jgi:hypothetical protein
VEDPNGYCNGNFVAGIEGSLSTENNYGVENAEISITGSENAKLISEVNGNFEYSPPLPEGNYVVKPKKKNDYLNGVNTLDVIQIQKHILGIKQLSSPYKYIAADVDNSKKITASDILNIRKLILGEVNEFKNNDSWKFIDYNYKFQNADEPLNETYTEYLSVNKLNKKIWADFTGIKIGDVNQSAIPNKLMALAQRTSEDMIIRAEEKQLSKGEITTVSFANKDVVTLEGMQFTFQFDPEYLEFNGIYDAKFNLTNDNIGLKHIGRGLLTFSWNDTKALYLESGTALFDIGFKVKKSGVLSDLVKVNSNITEALAFDKDGTEKGIQLEFRSENAEDFVLYQNEPNPWAATTNIRYDLPKAGKVKMSVSNGFGIVLEERILDSKKGANTVTIDKESINYSGLLIIDMEFEGKHQIRKMIKF